MVQACACLSLSWKGISKKHQVSCKDIKVVIWWSIGSIWCYRSLFCCKRRYFYIIFIVCFYIIFKLISRGMRRWNLKRLWFLIVLVDRKFWVFKCPDLFSGEDNWRGMKYFWMYFVVDYKIPSIYGEV